VRAMASLLCETLSLFPVFIVSCFAFQRLVVSAKVPRLTTEIWSLAFPLSFTETVLS
jgi:hypothetical protein